MLSAARIEQLYPIKTGMDSPNTKISRGNWSLVVVRKFIAERIISYRNENENSGILLTNRDFHLQTGNLACKPGLSFTKLESWFTNGILSLLFTLLQSNKCLKLRELIINYEKTWKSMKNMIYLLINTKICSGERDAYKL